MRKATGVVAVSLHRHRRECLLGLPRFHEHSVNAAPGKATDQPFRHRPGFQSHALELALVRQQQISERVRAGGHLGFTHEGTVSIHHADSRLLQRDIKGGE
jgi:hypothetical protein